MSTPNIVRQTLGTYGFQLHACQ